MTPIQFLDYFLDSIDHITSRSYYRQTERVFCYELYHQMRTLQNEPSWREHFNTGNTQNLIISSEITKFNRTYPDFVFHNDLTQDNNDISCQFAVIEVKLSGAPNEKISADIRKLYSMINNLDYTTGVFLYIGSQRSTFIRKIKDILIEMPDVINFLLDDNHDSKIYFVFKRIQMNNNELIIYNAEIIDINEILQ